MFCAGNYTVTGDYSETVSVWRVSNADIVLQLVHPAVVTRIAVSEWSYKAVTADENNFQYVWNLRNGQNLLKMEGPKVKLFCFIENKETVCQRIFNNVSDARSTCNVLTDVLCFLKYLGSVFNALQDWLQLRIN